MTSVRRPVRTQVPNVLAWWITRQLLSEAPFDRAGDVDPVFSSDVHGDTSGVLLADAPAGSYVLMCHALDRWRTQGPYYAAQIEVT